MDRFDRNGADASPMARLLRESGATRRSAPVWLVGMIGLVAISALAAGCSSNSTSATTTTTSSTTTTGSSTPTTGSSTPTTGSSTPTTGSSTPTTRGGTTVPPAATGAIATFETANGPAAGTWVIASSAVSAADSAYVYFRIGPAPGHENTVQGGYGFVHNRNGAWTVTGFGSSEVGCPPASPQNQIVPPAVLGEFGVGCPAP